jgi:hypothetical protein
MKRDKSAAIIFTKWRKVPGKQLKLLEQKFPWLAETKYLGLHLRH